MDEEYLEVFDDNGNSTGKSVTRSEAHREGILHGASHTYIYKIVNGKVYILLQRRSFNKDSFPGQLDISSAGHVEAGMDFKATAIKELQEELGITVSPEELQEAFFQRYSSIDEFRGEPFNNQEVNMIYLLEKDLDISNLTPQPEEVEEFVWMDASEIQKRIQANDKEFCLVEKEFNQVIDKINERIKGRNMSDQNQFTRKIYEDAMITGRFSYSEIFGRLLDKKDELGNAILPNTMIKKGMAASFARRIPGADHVVASAIAMGVELGRPVYGATGEKFLREKVANYKRSNLGVTLTGAILKGLDGKRIQSIQSGVQRVLDGADDLTVEEKCAEGAIRMHDLALRSNDPSSVNDRLMGDTFKVIRETGTFAYPDSFYELSSKYKTDERIEAINQNQSAKLKSAFNYFMQHQLEMSQEFTQNVNNMSSEELVAYYVASMGENSIEQIVAKNPRDIDE